MASELIDDDVLNVMQALCKVRSKFFFRGIVRVLLANARRRGQVCAFDPTKTAFDNFKTRSVECKFKRGRGTSAPSSSNSYHQYETDDDLVDLNMLTLKGAPETIASRVAPLTEPQLDVSQVQSVIFDDMVGKSFPPMSGSMYSLKSFNFLQQHIIDGHTHYINNVNHEVTHEYLCSVPCSTQVLAEYEKKGAQGQLFFAHAIMPLLDMARIEDAFYNATMTLTYPRTKVIKGVMMDQYPDLFKVVHWTDEFVKDWVEKMDQNAHQDLPMQRAEGICIANTEQRLTSMEQNMFLSVRLNGARTDHDQTYFDICTDRSTNHSKILDWEMEQAKRVTFAAGIPLDDAVFYTDAEVHKRYDDYVARDPKSASVTTLDMDYPTSIIREREEDVIVSKHISAQMTGFKRPRVAADDAAAPAAAAAAPQRRPRHPRITGRSVQERRALAMPVTEGVPVTHQQNVSSGSGNAVNLLARVGVNARKN